MCNGDIICCKCSGPNHLASDCMQVCLEGVWITGHADYAIKYSAFGATSFGRSPLSAGETTQEEKTLTAVFGQIQSKMSRLCLTREPQRWLDLHGEGANSVQLRVGGCYCEEKVKQESGG